MQFAWHKGNQVTETVDTATSRSVWAARYLARNWPTVCGHHLDKLVDAYQWLSSFRSPHEELLAGLQQLGRTLREVAEHRWIDQHLLLIDTDSPTLVACKHARNAIAGLLAKIEGSLLTGFLPVHPSLVSEGNGPPPTQIPASAKVLADAWDLDPVTLAKQGQDGLAAYVRAHIDEVMRRGYPSFSDLVTDPDERAAAFDRAWPELSPYVAMLRDYGLLLTGARNTAATPMAKWSDPDRRLLLKLRLDLPVHPLETVSTPLNHDDPAPLLTGRAVALRRAVREELIRRRDRDAVGDNWAELLIRDGFDPSPITSKLSDPRLGHNQKDGYLYQARQTINAWSEYRLIDVERQVGLGANGMPRSVDTIELVDPVAPARYREYKSYNPQGQPPEDQSKTFAAQLRDYTALLGRNDRQLPTEYRFEYGIPDWVRAPLGFYRGDFIHGLYANGELVT